MAADVSGLFNRVPLGWSVVAFRGHRYGVTRSAAVGGRSQSVYAEELGGREVVSANLYLTATSAELRPCEMPVSTVIDFLTELEPESAPARGLGPGA